MPLSAGTRLGPYEVTAQIGAGGMGEVYQATDTKLEREVAVKILPEKMAERPDRMARFQREAKLLAALDHPHIAAIHGLHEEDGQHFLVMELVDGETLADRLRRGPLPVQDAFEVGRQIAEALEAAHDKDIIHRDLKPSNVMLTSKGRAKVLDFGLGRVLEREAFVSSIETGTTPDETGTGVVVGTAPYMSPEQARGEDVNQRTDIWAFGCVLFEMLTGKRAFPGGTTSDAIAAVLQQEPDWEALPETAGPNVRSLLRRCLRKDKARRLHDIADAGIELEEALAEPVSLSSGTVSLPAKPAVRQRIAYWAASIVAVASTGVIVWTLARPEPVPHSPLRLSIVPSRSARLGPSYNSGVLALSPDGTRLVYVAWVAGKTQLYLRPMDQLEATPIPSTEGARTPFFSPDGESVGFWLPDRGFMKVSLQGGTPTAIGDGNYQGASWGPDGTVLFVERGQSGRLLLVSEDGGPPQDVTTVDRGEGERDHRWPQILPGGKTALFTLQAPSGRHDECGIGLLSLETGEWRVLFEGGTFARYLPSGHVVFTRYGSLLAVPFDLQRLEVTGDPTPVLEDVAMYRTGYAYLAVSATGSLAYVPRRYAPPERSLVWIDRQGRTMPVTEDRRAYRRPRISPDGTRLAMGIRRADGQDVWVHDLRQRTWTRLTFEKDNEVPVWSPDGRWLVFTSNREGNKYLFRIPADGSGAPERMKNSPSWAYVQNWSRDGRFLLVWRAGDVSVLPLEEGAEAWPYLVTAFDEEHSQFSPDGRWVAYASDESGRPEVYVRSFPDPGRKWPVSTSGGLAVRWSRDGRELFFQGLDAKQVMVAAVRTEPTFRAEPPTPLFKSEHPFGDAGDWDVMPDGQRFVAVLMDEEEPEPEQIVVIPNFADELKAKMAEAGQ